MADDKLKTPKPEDQIPSTDQSSIPENPMTGFKTPLEEFEEGFDKLDALINEFSLTDAQWHKLMEIRALNNVLMSKVNYIHPIDRVKIHEKISKLNFAALRIGY